MTITDFVWISVGELLLAATFALGMLVGCSMRQRKATQHDDSDERA